MQRTGRREDSKNLQSEKAEQSVALRADRIEDGRASPINRTIALVAIDMAGLWNCESRSLSRGSSTHVFSVPNRPPCRCFLEFVTGTGSAMLDARFASCHV
jgi:hypothetical protein